MGKNIKIATDDQKVKIVLLLDLIENLADLLMTVSKYYKYAIVFPALLIILGYIIFAVIYVALGIDNNYKSEWLTSNSFLLFSISIVIINSIFISILSTTIFLNRYNKIREKIILSFLSWFLLPSVWIGYLLIKHSEYLANSQNGFDEESIFVFSNTLPFLIGLVWTFAKFRTDYKKHL